MGLMGNRGIYMLPQWSAICLDGGSLHRRSLKKKASRNEVPNKDDLTRILINLLKAGVDDLLHLVAPTQEQQYGGLATGSLVDDPLADICEIPQSQQEVLDKTAFYQEVSCEASPANGPVVFPEPPKRGRLEDTREEIDYFSSLNPTLWRVEYASW